MKYPYRIEVYFEEAKDKFAVIQKINRFTLHECQGEYAKAHINGKTDYTYGAQAFIGVELMFASHRDAVHFKMGFESHGERIKSKVLTPCGEEEKGT